MVDLKSRGPWHVVFDKETGAFFIAEELCPLAGVNWDYASGYDEPSSWDWETARLMAAAPELLESVEALVDFIALIGSEGDPMQAELITNAQAALAKAKGEE